MTDKRVIYTNWSPDGEHLAFSSSVIGNLDIYSIDIDGNNLLQLTSDSYNDIRPIWSPDSKSIAFQSNRDQSSIFVMNADGANIRKIVDEATIGETVFTPYDDDVSIWSEDSNKIVFKSGQPGKNSIYVVNIDGSNLHRLIGPENVFDATWSADGKLIAVTRKVDNQTAIYVIDPDGNNLSLLVPDAYSPIWSQEAGWIAFFTNDVDFKKPAIGRLQILKVHDTFRRSHSISVDQFRSIANLSWSPDRQYFAFAACVGDADIFIVNVSDGAMTNVTDEPLDSIQPSVSVCNGVG